MRRLLLIASLLALSAGTAGAAEIKVLTAGAYKQIVLALQPDFEKRTGHTLIVDNGTVGQLTKRIEEGEAFDVVIASPGALDGLAKKGKIVPGIRVVLARVGVGVMVREGAPKPDIPTVEAFKKSLLAAKSVAYIDPASGGSSGIYLAGLFEKLGIADQLKPKAKLIFGGLVAEHVAKGEAEIGIHQMSEIVPVKGVTLVGALPAEIQNFTTYAGGLGAATGVAEPAKDLIRTLAGPAAAPVLKSKGMAPAL
ncbi:MAG TPA: substrate-binding domain-containing protein [Xanthobacteraceae bacterium]|nr:substrate-binding domain-containing protein [Xanthobacteraceae bacterium]